MSPAQAKQCGTEVMAGEHGVSRLLGSLTWLAAGHGSKHRSNTCIDKAKTNWRLMTLNRLSRAKLCIH